MKDQQCDFSGIVAETEGYLNAEFFCSNEWKGCKKVAGFTKLGKEYYAPVINGRCQIPKEALTFTSFEVRLYGKREGYRITTNSVTIHQEGVRQ
ncbi:hypothetical protein [Sellimonas intestinalis]|jgi:hypothetical protein|nr:hypothetical protein [Sellimonas intestinalis]